jgi:hypothetical protein
MVDAMPFAIGHLISGRGHQPHLENGRVNKLVIDFLKTSLTSREELLEAFGEEGEKLTWQYMIFEQYQQQAWLQPAFVSEAPKKARVAPPEPLTIEEKKTLLMRRFETQLDGLLEWYRCNPRTTPEQFDQALSDLRKQLDAEITSVLIEGGDGVGQGVDG